MVAAIVLDESAIHVIFSGATIVAKTAEKLRCRKQVGNYCTIHPKKNSHDEHKTDNGPESPASLKWDRGAKNPRVENKKY